MRFEYEDSISFYRVVMFENGQWTIKNADESIDTLFQSHNDMQVVGNIFEKPELLKATTTTIGYADQGVLQSAT